MPSGAKAGVSFTSHGKSTRYGFGIDMNMSPINSLVPLAGNCLIP